jgi:hypothetical protein
MLTHADACSVMPQGLSDETEEEAHMLTYADVC